jgi:DNA-binding transcriptional LysR family regulator
MLNEIDLSRTDLNLFTLFETVLEERHVGRAAARLNLSPSAVSHGLGRLRRLLNDPLFLRTPKGVVPTERALKLAPLIDALLAQAREIVGNASPFDPATTTRRFTIGAPDGITTTILPRLLAYMGSSAPGIGVSTRNTDLCSAFEDLDARRIDLALVPLDDIPARFAHCVIYREDFVITARRGHSFSRKPTLQHYCAAEHCVISLVGDPWSNVDIALEEQHLSRRVALTVPNVLLALLMVSSSDLLAALPRRLVVAEGDRFGVVAVEPPLALGDFRIRAVVPQTALRDQGIAWLIQALQDATGWWADN